MEQETVTCSRCLQPIQRETDSGGTGYGTDQDGNKFCYECCGIRDNELMSQSDRYTLYLITIKDPISKRFRYELQNWCGTFKIKDIVSKSESFNNVHVVFAWNEELWYGDCRDPLMNQLCYCRKYKRKWKLPLRRARVVSTGGEQ